MMASKGTLIDIRHKYGDGPFNLAECHAISVKEAAVLYGAGLREDERELIAKLYDRRVPRHLIDYAIRSFTDQRDERAQQALKELADLGPRRT